MRKYVLITLSVTLLLAAGGAGARVKLSALPSREKVVINFSRDGQTLVRENRTLPLERGRNKIDFSWANVRLDPYSVRLLIPGNEQGVNLLSVSYPPDEQALVWHVGSNRSRQLKISIVYLLDGLNRDISYRGFVSKNGSHLELREITSLFNTSGENFSGTLLSLGGGNIHRRDWKDGEAKRFSVYRKKKIPLNKHYIFDARKQPHHPERADRAPGIPVFYTLANSRDYRLGDKTLMAGKVRLYRRRKNGGEIFTGEDKLSSSPPGDSISLRLGSNRDIKVTQNKVSRERRNVIRDDRGRIEMYDSEETVEVLIENRKNTPINLHVLEEIKGDWEMIENNFPFQKLSNKLIKFKITVPAEEEKKLQFHYLRHHVGREL